MRFDMVAGDLEPPIEGKLGGFATALPSDATVHFTMAQADGGVRITGIAAIIDPGSATTPIIASYVWQHGDTIMPGVYRAQWRGILANGAPFTFPSDEELFVIIRPAL